MRFGKSYCFSHFISANDLEEIVLSDIREKAAYITFDEQAVREEFLKRNTELSELTLKSTKLELQNKKSRSEELKRLIQVSYEDRVRGKIPEDLCIEFIEKYSAEQKQILSDIERLEQEVAQSQTKEVNADEFIKNIKKYLKVPALTREICYELIDRVIVGGHPKMTGKERVIEIVYKADIAFINAQ